MQIESVHFNIVLAQQKFLLEIFYLDGRRVEGLNFNLIINFIIKTREILKRSINQAYISIFSTLLRRLQQFLLKTRAYFVYMEFFDAEGVVNVLGFILIDLRRNARTLLENTIFERWKGAATSEKFRRRWQADDVERHFFELVVE